MNTLPVNYAGLALIILSVVLFILEVKIASHGALTIGGVVALFLGSIMLINTDSFMEAVEISMELIILVVVLTAAFFIFAVSMGIKAQRKKPTTGMEGLIGETGRTVTKLSPSGKIKIHGEFWNAECLNGEIEVDTEVEVTAVKNLLLKVKKFEK